MSIPAPSCILKLAMPALLFLACAKGPQSGDAGHYLGVATNRNEIGILDVTVAEADKGPLPATGTLKFPSKTITLTGTLDQSKTQLSLSSSDGYTLVGESRPTYAFGSYKNATDEEQGSFGLIPQPATSSPVQLYCGSYWDTTVTQQTSYPLAITATAGGNALCVGQNFAWVGVLGTDDSVACAFGGGTFNGNVNTAGNPWGTGEHYGSWTVSPCADNGAGGDGGVSDGSAEFGPDADVDTVAPAPDVGIDAAVDGAVPAPDAGIDAAFDSAVPSADAGTQD
jgi:hypothetical protein